MANTNFPNTSFMNLFNNIVYDPTTNPHTSLDIWDAYVIAQFFQEQVKYFTTHKVSATDTWVSLALFYYSDERLWWVIPLFNIVEDPFIVMSKNMLMDTINELAVLQPQYINQFLLTARQQKIQNDRAFSQQQSTNPLNLPNT